MHVSSSASSYSGTYHRVIARANTGDLCHGSSFNMFNKDFNMFDKYINMLNKDSFNMGNKDNMVNMDIVNKFYRIAI
jgi:hypothetical protein